MERSLFIWDFDGLIAYTSHEEAWAEACKIYGIEGFDHDFYNNYVSGLPRYLGSKNILEKLNYFSKHNVKDMESIIKDFAELKTEIYLNMIKERKYLLNYSVINFILESKKLKILQALASASHNVLEIANREEVKPGMKLIELFDINVSGKGKTKEEIFKLAISEGKKRCNPLKYILVFEDSPSGIKAAKSLGCIAIGCFNEKLKSQAPDLIVYDFSSLKVEELYKALNIL